MLAAVVIGAGALLAPAALGPTVWLGLGAADLVPGAFLVVAGAGIGWRHDTDRRWPPARRWRRAGVLVVLGTGIAVARAGGDPGALAIDELLRLWPQPGRSRAWCSGGARWSSSRSPVCWRSHPPRWSPVTRSAAGSGGPTRQPRGALEGTLGLPGGGVPLLSLAPAVALCLAGAAFGIWAHRRPPGPAPPPPSGPSAGGAWSARSSWASVVPPVPVLLDLPVALAAVGCAALALAAGHLAAHWGAAPGLAAVGRTALPIVVTGTFALAFVPPSVVPDLPTAAALTAGGVAAWAALLAGRHLDATRWVLRA